MDTLLLLCIEKDEIEYDEIIIIFNIKNEDITYKYN